MTLAEQIKQVMGKYEAMVSEGEQLAAENKRMFGDWKPDTSQYVTLTDHTPARTAWKNAQADMVGIIRQLTDIVTKQHEVMLLEKQIGDAVFWGDSGDKNKRAAVRGYRRKRNAALALSAPIVKGVE